MTSIGTLFAFALVCIGIIVMRKKEPNIPRPFKTPFVPLVPILGAGVCLLMILWLGGENWLRLLVWLAIGFVIYFGYSIAYVTVSSRKKTEREFLERTAHTPSIFYFLPYSFIHLFLLSVLLFSPG